MAAGFAPSGAINYPLEVGELVGVIRFARSGGDFRGQKIRKGVYAVRLRFAAARRQPCGNF